MVTESQHRLTAFLSDRDVPATLLDGDGTVVDVCSVEDLCLGLLGSLAAGDTVNAPNVIQFLITQFPNGMVPERLTSAGTVASGTGEPGAVERARMLFALLLSNCLTLPPFGNPHWDYFTYDSGALWGEVTKADALTALNSLLSYIDTLTLQAVFDAAGVQLLRESALAALVCCHAGAVGNNDNRIAKGVRLYRHTCQTFLRDEGYACAILNKKACLDQDTEGLSFLGLTAIFLDDTPREEQIERFLQHGAGHARHKTAAGSFFSDGYRQFSTGAFADCRATMLAVRFLQLRGQDARSRTVRDLPHLRQVYGPLADVPYRSDLQLKLSFSSALLDSGLDSDLLILQPWLLQPRMIGGDS